MFYQILQKVLSITFEDFEHNFDNCFSDDKEVTTSNLPNQI